MMADAPRDDSTRDPAPRPPARVRAVLFDLDGTLITSTLDFAAIRREIGVVDGTILDHVASLPPEDAARALSIVEDHERRSADGADALPGVRAWLTELSVRGVAAGIVTNNTRTIVHAVLERLGLTCDVLICREDAPGKPRPDPILLALAELHVSPEEAVFVGDAELDVTAGRAAAVWTIHVGPSCRGECAVHVADMPAARRLLEHAG